VTPNATYGASARVVNVLLTQGERLRSAKHPDRTVPPGIRGGEPGASRGWLRHYWIRPLSYLQFQAEGHHSSRSATAGDRRPACRAAAKAAPAVRAISAAVVPVNVVQSRGDTP
jgi:hypothetical protein